MDYEEKLAEGKKLKGEGIKKIMKVIYLQQETYSEVHYPI